MFNLAETSKIFRAHPFHLRGLGAPRVFSHAGAWERGDSVFSPGTEMHSAVPMGLRASGCHDPGNELPGYFRVSPWDRYGVDFQAPSSVVMKIKKSAPGIFPSFYTIPPPGRRQINIICLWDSWKRNYIHLPFFPKLYFHR